jgi:hypothetical protein
MWVGGCTSDPIDPAAAGSISFITRRPLLVDGSPSTRSIPPQRDSLLLAGPFLLTGEMLINIG